MPHGGVIHSVVETSIFFRRADALLEREDRFALITTLAGDPTAGALIPGLGGIRKLRFAPTGRGPSVGGTDRSFADGSQER